ncbi:hypothetical protein [Paraflavitalea speifideaquila]|uniref:hypothetical protein n=1 Tax=Paraflavitalea speifideaquila TaxID=3076558 RepID=UPI0028E3B8E8|nr:hypothetical protein [Paraflavitalea speifideiaquila]
MKTILYGGVAFFLLLAACATKSKYYPYQSRLLLLGGNKLTHKYSAVILIPQEGCGGASAMPLITLRNILIRLPR